MLELLLTLLLHFATGVQPHFVADPSTRQTGETYTAGPLPVGGSLTGVDGVTIDASRANYDREIPVFVERLEIDELGVMPPNLGTPVTAFYRIGGISKYHTRGATPFYIHIPLPEDVNTAGIGAFLLAPVEGATDLALPEGHPGVWISSGAAYLPDTREAVLSLPLLRPKGIIVGIGKGIFRSK